MLPLTWMWCEKGKKMVSEIQRHNPEIFMIYPVLFLLAGVYVGALFAKDILELFFGLLREKIQFIRTEGTPGLVRLSSDADLVMLLR